VMAYSDTYPPHTRGRAPMLGSHRYYEDRAADMRQVAGIARTERVRESCLKAAEQYEELARLAAQGAADAGTNG